mmetsp:Transcript_40998/g.112769  ORF Transcript_40998/g.112769 Transcript_40998/m.112769 type:complete len:105 (+) Transcript_40998:225-539(+)
MDRPFEDDTVDLTVHGISGDVICVLQVGVKWPVSRLKAAITEATGTSARDQKLTANGGLLSDDVILGETFGDCAWAVTLAQVAPMDAQTAASCIGGAWRSRRAK